LIGNENTKSIWLETESGVLDEADPQYIPCLAGIDLEEELLYEITQQAWHKAEKKKGIKN